MKMNNVFTIVVGMFLVGISPSEGSEPISYGAPPAAVSESPAPSAPDLQLLEKIPNGYKTHHGGVLTIQGNNRNYNMDPVFQSADYQARPIGSFFTDYYVSIPKETKANFLIRYKITKLSQDGTLKPIVERLSKASVVKVTKKGGIFYKALTQIPGTNKFKIDHSLRYFPARLITTQAYKVLPPGGILEDAVIVNAEICKTSTVKTPQGKSLKVQIKQKCKGNHVVKIIKPGVPYLPPVVIMQKPVIVR